MQDYLLKSIEIHFFDPETTFIHQFDLSNKNVYIVGDGAVTIFNQRRRRKEVIRVLQAGSLINEVTALFDHRPQFSYESKAYNTMGLITNRDFKEMLMLFPSCHSSMVATVLGNPFDLDRNYFVLKCRQDVHYFKDVPDDRLKRLYYEADTRTYELDQLIFEKGDPCEYIYIVVSGVLGIELTDGVSNFQHIDYMGRGSILGANSVISGARWHYRCVSRSRHSASLIQISRRLVTRFALDNEDVR